MTARRLAPGFLVWLVGLLLGSLAPQPVPPAPATIDLAITTDASSAGGRAMRPAAYQMLAADFHVHSFPGDGALWPWDIAAEARRRGLHVIALTNHNQALSSRLALAAKSWMPAGVMVLPGEEVTSPGFHVSAVGLDRAVHWARSPKAVIDAVHAAGGVAIAAHPARGYGEPYDAEALRMLDGVETAHPMTDTDVRGREIEAFYARAREAKPSIAAIGSSDFHREAPVGMDRTFVFVTKRTGAAVLDAVRAGRTVACDARGRVTGSDPWASLARPSCQTTMARAGLSAARGGGALHAFAVGCALAGLAAMVCSRQRA